MGTKQCETATVIGTVVLSGNAEVIITGGYLSSSPVTVSVAVDALDTASLVAGKIRSALGLTAAITAQYAVSGTGADVILTDHQERANDATLNIAVDNDTCTGLTAAPTSANTTAGTGITNGYCTLAQLKTRLGVTDAVDDDALEKVISAVSRQIEKATHRRFWTTAVDETRYYTPDGYYDLFPEDDILSITTLKTDDDGDRTFENTWATTDYDAMPFNSTPKLWLKVAVNGNYVFPKGITGGVEITGKFGYSSETPDEVREACIIQAVRLWNRKSAPFGIMGSQATGEMFVIKKLDPDVENILEPLTRLI